MTKEVNDKACALDLATGLNGVSYKQDFVKAPKSLYPKEVKRAEPNFEASEAMRVTEGK